MLKDHRCPRPRFETWESTTLFHQFGRREPKPSGFGSLQQKERASAPEPFRSPQSAQTSRVLRVLLPGCPSSPSRAPASCTLRCHVPIALRGQGDIRSACAFQSLPLGFKGSSIGNGNTRYPARQYSRNSIDLGRSRHGRDTEAAEPIEHTGHPSSRRIGFPLFCSYLAVRFSLEQSQVE